MADIKKEEILPLADDISNIKNQIQDIHKKLIKVKKEPKEKKENIRTFYIRNADNYTDTFIQDMSNQQKAMLSYGSLSEENKNRIKKDFDEYIKNKQ